MPDNHLENIEILKQINETKTSEKSIDFPEYRGMTFEQFWKALPRKLEYFDYEKDLYETLEKNKKLWVKKATGLGVTEFFTRYIAWNCLKDNEWRDAQVDVSAIIITGANQDLTNKVIGRIKNLFDAEFKTKESVVVLNGCKIEAFPTNHLSPARGLNPRIVLLDEGDFFPARYQDEARTVAERYIPKTDPVIAMVSTPNLPGGLFERMEEEYEHLNENQRKEYYVMKHLNYEIGLDKVFSKENIETAKLSPSFEREYNLKYGFGMGDIFDLEALERCIVDDTTRTDGARAVVCGDPAFGSSNFGVVGADATDKVNIIEANEYPRPSPSAMLDVIENMAHQYNDNVKIDAAHPGFIRDLEQRGIPALPVNFGLQIRDHETANVQSLRSKMTINAAQMVKNEKVRIPRHMTKLLSQLRAAQFDKKGGVDKEELNFDVGDAFIMALWDLKEFDYGHYDVMENKLIKINTEPEKPRSKGISINTEVIE